MTKNKPSRFPSIKAITQLTLQWKKKEWDSEEAKHVFDKIGFEFFDCGTSRMVYYHKKANVVLKVQKVGDSFNGKPLNQNKTEIETSQNLPESIKKFFVMPIAFSKDAFWIIMPKAETYIDLGVEEAIKVKDYLRNALRDNGFAYDDFLTCNIGKVNGQPVIIDYGYSIRPSK